MTMLHRDRRRFADGTPRATYEGLLRIIKASKPANARLNMDLYKLIRVADAFRLGDSVFQKKLSDYARVDGWTDAALLIANAALQEPLPLILKTGLGTDEAPSAQLGLDDQPVHASTLALAILGAVLQHKIKEFDT
jgi:hypothetical protein